MINPENFKRLMALIADRTPNVPNEDTLLVYYGFLNPRMTDEEFTESAMSIFAEAEFFPPPVRFLEIRASREWPLVMDLLVEFTPPHVVEGWEAKWLKMSEAARGAIVQFGGPLAFKGQIDRGVMRARSEFMEAYREVVRDAAINARVFEARQAPKAVPIEAVQKPPQLEPGQEGD